MIMALNTVVTCWLHTECLLTVIVLPALVRNSLKRWFSMKVYKCLRYFCILVWKQHPWKSHATSAWELINSILPLRDLNLVFLHVWPLSILDKCSFLLSSCSALLYIYVLMRLKNQRFKIKGEKFTCNLIPLVFFLRVCRTSSLERISLQALPSSFHSFSQLKVKYGTLQLLEPTL